MKNVLILCCALLVTTSTWAGMPEADEPLLPGAGQPPLPQPGPPMPAPVERSPGWQPAPTSIGAWADRCSDFTINGWGFKDPKNFVKLTQLFSNPAIYLEFSRRMQDPESYARVAGLIMDPRTTENYMEWSNPVIYSKWMQALMDPNFYTEAMRPFMDPSTYVHWMSLSTDQSAWNVGGNMMNPAMWMKWMTAWMNPKVMEPFTKISEASASRNGVQAAGDPPNAAAWLGWGQSPGQAGGFVPFNAGTAPRAPQR
ncbi:MAG: hypothetical protein ACLPXB_03280 [Thiobacillaceae bacterium]